METQSLSDVRNLILSGAFVYWNIFVPVNQVVRLVHSHSTLENGDRAGVTQCSWGKESAGHFTSLKRVCEFFTQYSLKNNF
jgi:hypothetical protein